MAWDGFSLRRKKEMPDGLFMKCNSCEKMIYRKTVAEALNVCPECNFHFTITSLERIALLLDDGKLEETSLEICEFIRRFLLHVLPNGYFKIRYYGILASRNRPKLRMAQEILGDEIAYEQPEETQKTFEEWFFELTGIEPGICPFCKKGRLIRKVQLAPAPS